MSARLQEAFRAGALAAFPSIRFQARPSPKPPRQTESSDSRKGKKQARSRRWTRNAGTGCGRTVAGGIRSWIEVLDGAVQAAYPVGGYFLGRTGDAIQFQPSLPSLPLGPDLAVNGLQAGSIKLPRFPFLRELILLFPLSLGLAGCILEIR